LKQTILLLLGNASEDGLLAGIPLSPELVTPEVEGCSSSELSSSSSSSSSLFSSLSLDKPESQSRPSSSSSSGFGGYTRFIANRFD